MVVFVALTLEFLGDGGGIKLETTNSHLGPWKFLVLTGHVMGEEGYLIL